MLLTESNLKAINHCHVFQFVRSFCRCFLEMIWPRGKSVTGCSICCDKLHSPHVRKKIELLLNNVNKINIFMLLQTRSIGKGTRVYSAVGGCCKGRKIQWTTHGLLAMLHTQLRTTIMIFPCKGTNKNTKLKLDHY